MITMKESKTSIDRLKKTFNEDVVNYDRSRPDYPEQLFSDIFSYSNISAQSRLLEIGIGTGQATAPFLNLGCTVTGIELGDNLSNYVEKKYQNYPNFQVINDDFMLYPIEENSLDLIYSATAFHWLPQSEAYCKIKKALKPGGTLALFWNHPFPNRIEDPSNRINMEIYQKYRPSDKKQIEFCEADCQARVQALSDAGFNDVEYKIYHRVRTLETNEYIHLLNTYSDHRMLDPEIRNQFESDMKKSAQERRR